MTPDKVTYRVVFKQARTWRRGPWWFAEAPELPGCHCAGPTLVRVRGAITAAIASATGTERVSVALDAAFAGLHCEAEAAVAQANRAQEARRGAARLTADAVHALLDEGFDESDVAVIAGVSPQRVAQIVDRPE